MVSLLTNKAGEPSYPCAHLVRNNEKLENETCMTLYSQTSIKQPPSRKGQIPGEPKGRWEGVLDQYLGIGEPLRV